MRPYCLYCFATIEEHQPCPACGHHSSPADRKRYWNHSPRLRRFQAGLKILSAILMALLIPSFLDVGGGSGTSPGFFFLLPIFALAPVWLTISGLTREQPYFMPTAMWSVAAAGLGGVLAFSHWSGWLLAIAGVGAAQGAGKLARSWKRRLQEEEPSPTGLAV